MAERVWLTVEEAAARVDRGESTIRRWIKDGDLYRPQGGKRVIEEQLLEVDRAMRQNRGGDRRSRHDEPSDQVADPLL